MVRRLVGPLGALAAALLVAGCSSTAAPRPAENSSQGSAANSEASASQHGGMPASTAPSAASGSAGLPDFPTAVPSLTDLAGGPHQVINPAPGLTGQAAWTVPGKQAGSLIGVTATTVVLATQDGTYSGYSYDGDRQWSKTFPGAATAGATKKVGDPGMVLLGNLLVSAWTEPGDGPGTVEVDAYSADTGKQANPPIVYQDRRGVVPELWGYAVMDLYDNESTSMHEFWAADGTLHSKTLTSALAANSDVLRRQGWPFPAEDALNPPGATTDGAIQLTEGEAVRVFTAAGVTKAQLVDLATKKTVGPALACGASTMAYGQALPSPSGTWMLIGASLLIDVPTGAMRCVDKPLEAARASADGGAVVGDQGGIYITAGTDTVAYLAPGADKAELGPESALLPGAVLPKVALVTVGAIEHIKPGTLIAVKRHG